MPGSPRSSPSGPLLSVREETEDAVVWKTSVRTSLAMFGVAVMFMLFAASLDHAIFLEISQRLNPGVEFVHKPLKGRDLVFLTPLALVFNAVGVCAWPTARGVRWHFDRASGTISRTWHPLIGPAWSRTWRAAEVREIRCFGGSSFTVQLALAGGGRVQVDSGFDEAAAAAIVSDAGRALGLPPVKPHA